MSLFAKNPTTIAVAVAGLGLGLVAVSAAANADQLTGASHDPSQPQPATITMVECVEDNLVSEPDRFVTACADGQQYLDNLTWSEWGDAEAHARGTLVTTLDGDERVDVEVTASERMLGADGGRYTLLTITPVGGGEPELIQLP